jgi:RNA polymerase sigma-70 factor (ECF subfamily)
LNVTTVLASFALGLSIFSLADRSDPALTDRSAPPQLDLVSALDQLGDEDLMLRYAEGQAAAFDVLVLRYRRRIYSFLLRRVRNPARAEELLSDVFLKLHRAAPRYSPQARFSTYLYTIAYRASMNAQSRQRNRRDEGVGGLQELDAVRGKTLGADLASPDRALRSQRAVERLDRELAKLPEGQQAAFTLYYREGLSCAEAAECLGISSAEVKGRLAYARKLLRERMSGFLDDGGIDLT